MTIKATVLDFANGIGGAVEIEDIESGDSVTLIERRSILSRNALRRLAVKRLRSIADRLEREIYRIEK